DRVNQGDAVVVEKLCDPLEVLIVVGNADVFEHADRHDAVKLSRRTSVVFEPKAGVAGEADAGDARVGDVQLFAGQRDASDIHIFRRGQEDAKSAPARADVQNLLAW